MPPSEIVRHPPQIGAFFDLDKTLIADNSATMFMRHRYEQGEATGMDLLKGLGAYLQYKVGILDIRSWTLSAMAQFSGESERSLEEMAAAWVEESVVKTIYPEARSLVGEHAAMGHVVAIISGATRFVVRPIAKHLGIEHMLYTRLEVEGGMVTGRVVEPICFEEGKIYWLQQFIEEHEIDLAKSYFYTDSITDLPLLDIVGHPVVTNPDPLLYRAAIKRRWPVRFFDPPAAVESA
jgi:putative phosphoserine phosphatase/1-acylglycerol-3-phosphate O-acyltransferase